MGVKALKEKFGINHHVAVFNEGICLGSGYVYNLAVINSSTGEIKENKTFSNFLADKYPALLNASPQEIVDLIAAPDTFAASVTVYTYDGGDIIAKQCEEPGWPNVTHDGCMMYDNTFSTDKEKVIKWAKRDAAARIEFCRERINAVENELTELRQQQSEAEGDAASLEAT